MQAPAQPHTHVGVGGEFTRVFDQEDYLGMVNSLDEASVVLRTHLILEEFLNIWSSRYTHAEDLFVGTFVPFKTKRCVCRNIGLSAEYVEVLDKFNEIRNRYSHRRKYALKYTRSINFVRRWTHLHAAPKIFRAISLNYSSKESIQRPAETDNPRIVDRRYKEADRRDFGRPSS